MNKIVAKQRIGEPYEDWFSKMVDDGKAIVVNKLVSSRYSSYEKYPATMAYVWNGDKIIIAHYGDYLIKYDSGKYTVKTGCPYCVNENVNLLNKDYDDSNAGDLLLDLSNSECPLLESDTDDCSFSKSIQYCPVCGRKLGQGRD